MATRKKPAKKAASTGKSAAAKKAPTKAAAAKKASSKAEPSKKSAAKKSAAKTATAKSSTTTSTAKKAGTKAAAAQKAPAKKAATTKTTDAKNPFGKKFIDAQEKQLRHERARYLASAQTWRAEADSLLEGREPGDVQFDEESGDGDTIAIERERDLALSNYARAAVEEIDEALKRVENGTYGICVTSGKPIPKDRLEAIPWAAERVEYKVAGFRRR